MTYLEKLFNMDAPENTVDAPEINTLTDITYKKLIKTLPRDVVNTLAEYALEHRKRNVVLMYSSWWRTIPKIVGQWKNVTKIELAYKIMEDSTLGNIVRVDGDEDEGEDDLFYSLLRYNKKLLKGHSIFNKEEDGGGLWWLDEDIGWDIEPKQIKYLYTKILTPERLLKDIEEIGEEPEEGAYFICFEDEASWGYAQFYTEIMMG